jgi:hypothetical protein
MLGPVLFRSANVRNRRIPAADRSGVKGPNLPIAAIASRRLCTNGCRAVLLSASAQLQVDNPDVVARRRGSKARNQAGPGRVFLCETAARWARGTRSN